MIKIDIENGFVIKEVSPEEYRTLVNPHFESLFKNRVDDYQHFEIDDSSKNKISKRNQVERFILRLIILKDNKLVGWHIGFEKEADTYYMQNSAVLEQYRNQGLYSKLLDAVLERLKDEGFQVIISAHHPHNAPVLIPKLKRGFFISGMQFHERFRSIVELKFIFNEQRRKHYFKCMGLEL